MITLNTRYIKPHNLKPICEAIEAIGATLATKDEEDPMYERDQLMRARGEHIQNLSAHDWESEVEWQVMERVFRAHGYRHQWEPPELYPDVECCPYCAGRELSEVKQAVVSYHDGTMHLNDKVSEYQCKNEKCGKSFWA